MIELPWGEKWVARYKESDGRPGMGMCNNQNALSPLVSAILNSGGYDIVITDETCRPKVIDVIGEDNEQHSSKVHTGAIGYSPVKEHE